MTGNSPLVSVVIPAYNHEKYVQKTIKSIISQTYKNIELIIINDGSKDKTWSKIQDMLPYCQERFTRFLIQTQPNQGTSITLNMAVSLCKGKYIAVIASDDMYLSDCIEKQVKVMEENPSIVQTFPDNVSIDAKGKPFKGFEWKNKFFPLKSQYWQAKYPNFDFSGEDFHSYKNVLEKDLWFNGFLWRKEAIDKIFPIPTEPMSEDYYINLQLAKLGLVKFINEPLFLYRMHETNTLKNKKYMRIIGSNARIAEIKNVLQPGQEKWKKILKEVWFKEEIKSFGFKNLCLQKAKNQFISEKRLKIFNWYLIFYRRKRYQVSNALLKHFVK